MHCTSSASNSWSACNSTQSSTTASSFQRSSGSSTQCVVVLLLCCHLFVFLCSVLHLSACVSLSPFPFTLWCRILLLLLLQVEDADSVDCVYDLFASVIHIGSRPSRGHYITVARSGDKWVVFDDDLVEVVGEEELQLFFGRTRTQTRNAQVCHCLARIAQVPGCPCRIFVCVRVCVCVCVRACVRACVCVCL